MITSEIIKQYKWMILAKYLEWPSIIHFTVHVICVENCKAQRYEQHYCWLIGRNLFALMNSLLYSISAEGMN